MLEDSMSIEQKCTYSKTMGLEQKDCSTHFGDSQPQFSFSDCPREWKELYTQSCSQLKKR